MSRWTSALVLCLTAGSLGAVALSGQPAPGGARPAPPVLGTDAASLTAALADYIDLFNEETSAVLAEERYVQLRHKWRGNPTGPESEPELAWRDTATNVAAHVTGRIQLLSDVLFVQVKDGDWMDYRDVAEVNGKPVRNRSQRVLDLFLSATPDAMARARRIAEESARHNLPGLHRTLNLPNTVLFLLRRSEQPRYSFKRAKDETLDGRQARVLEYREKARPTIVRTTAGDDIPINGRVWIDARDGRVLRTELRFDRGSRKSLIRVDYQPLDGQFVFVPARMWERYDDAIREGEMVERTGYFIQGLATYSGHKHFTVTTRETVK
ncbi:MAG: hypothetical protein MUF60_01835 [Vicinamibacterales bacterium]|jgi:hypothetical protein|nr:hypothetical protein [Vicinamibacterales bacterium]